MIFQQSLTTAHAVRYDDADHDHNGIACDIMQVAAEDIAHCPDLPEASEVTAYIDNDKAASFRSVAYITPQGRAPPPRSPPLTF